MLWIVLPSRPFSVSWMSAAVLMSYISMNCPMMFRFSSLSPFFLFLPILFFLCYLYSSHSASLLQKKLNRLIELT